MLINLHTSTPRANIATASSACRPGKVVFDGPPAALDAARVRAIYGITEAEFAAEAAARGRPRPRCPAARRRWHDPRPLRDGDRHHDHASRPRRPARRRLGPRHRRQRAPPRRSLDPDVIFPEAGPRAWGAQMKQIRIGLLGGENESDRLGRFGPYRDLIEATFKVPARLLSGQRLCRGDPGLRGEAARHRQHVARPPMPPPGWTPMAASSRC